jgi:hypothetical protein
MRVLRKSGWTSRHPAVRSSEVKRSPDAVMPGRGMLPLPRMDVGALLPLLGANLGDVCTDAHGCFLSPGNGGEDGLADDSNFLHSVVIALAASLGSPAAVDRSVALQVGISLQVGRGCGATYIRPELAFKESYASANRRARAMIAFLHVPQRRGRVFRRS